MMKGLKMWKPRRVTTAGIPTFLASVSKAGFLSFTNTFLKEGDLVDFYYDEDSKIIALKGGGETRMVRKPPKGQGYAKRVACTALIRMMKVDPGRYPLRVDGELMVIDFGKRQ